MNPGYESHWRNLVTDGYYRRAIEEIGDDATYLVMSDDMDWCRASLGIEGAEFVDVDHGASLCLMSICDVNIVANSSYSWWGAFLNPGADVYAPSRWFGPDMGLPNDRQDDIVLPTWRTIPTFAARAGAT